MKKNVIIHIPHSSLKLPCFFTKRVVISKEELNDENIKVCDLYTDKLIEHSKSYIIKFKYSRLFCDVEKFKDDDKEIMSKVGMGVVYKLTTTGKKLIEFDENYRNYVIKKYYDKYHKKIDRLTNYILKKYGSCFLLDLHSFSETQALETLNKKNCPDICLGIDNDFLDIKSKDYIIKILKEKGYNVKINYPYSGSFVPNVAYETKNNNVKSIMLEINKKLYLDKDNTLNKIKFNKLKKDINEIVIYLENNI